jgi:hypothetical protein
MDRKSPEYREAFELLKKIAEGLPDAYFPDSDMLYADLDKLVECGFPFSKSIIIN